MSTVKDLTRAASILFGSLALAAGCSDDEDDDDDGGYGGDSMSVGGTRTGMGGAKNTGGTRPLGGAGTTWSSVIHIGGGPSGTSSSTLAGGGLGNLGGNTSLTAGGASAATLGGSTSTAGGTLGTTGGTSTGGTAQGGTNATGVAGTATGVAGSLAAGAGGTSAGGTSAVAGSANVAGTAGVAGSPSTLMSFFVTSDTNTSGDLGGLSGADSRCQGLAVAVGRGAGVWRAYLSADALPSSGNVAVNARDRIGTGPWYNANGQLLANNLTQLHALTGNPDLFLDEHGARINGQWLGSPLPNEHDILTGSTANGTVMTGFNCEGWTSNSSGISAQVGHSDGLGPNRSTDPPYDSWNSSHANESCANTSPRGGAGRLYCFRAD